MEPTLWPLVGPFILIRDGGASLGLAEFGTGFVPVETGRWFLELVLDFDTQTEQAYVDGEFIGSGPFANASTEVTSVEIFILNWTPNPA